MIAWTLWILLTLLGVIPFTALTTFSFDRERFEYKNALNGPTSELFFHFIVGTIFSAFFAVMLVHAWPFMLGLTVFLLICAGFAFITKYLVKRYGKV